MISFHSSWITSSLELLSSIHFVTQVEIYAVCRRLLHTREESVIKLMIAAIASFSTTVRAKERVCRKLLLVIIIILIEVGVATHSVPWGHTVRLFTLKGASIRSIMLLALVEEVMGNRLMHTLSTNESTALRYRALFLMLLLASSHLTVGNRLLSIDVVRFHLYRCIKLFLYSLTGFTAIHILIGYAILLLSLRSVIVLSRLVWELASILECAI